MSLDVAIVGGGPVGMVTALLARDAGLDVVVIERKIRPVEKACGEGIMPAGLDILQRLGVDPPGHAFTGIRYLGGRRSADARFSDGPARGVRRTTLMRCLEEEATRRGVAIIGAKVGGVEQSEDRVRLELRGGPAIEAAYVVGADGLHSLVRRAAGLDARRDGTAKRRPAVLQRHGIRRRYAVAPWADLVEVYWAADAEAYVTPVGSDEVTVAVLTAQPGSFDDHLAFFPDLATRLSGAAHVSPDRGAGPFRQRSTARVSGRALLVGDAAGYVDALTGEGLTVGWRQAEAAVAAVVAGDPAAYERAWPGIVRRSSWLTTGLLAAAGIPALRRVILPAAASAPWLFRGLVNTAARG